MHISFPSLELFSSVFHRETYPETKRRVTFGAKIKLHGANIAVRIEPDGTVTAQSRKHDISLDSDLNNFSEWFDPQKSFWAKAAICQTLTFFGEWAGPGINKGDAVQQTDKKRFYLFAVGVGRMPHPQSDVKENPAWMITCPKAIASLLPDGIDADSVRVLPWEAHFTFDFNDEFSVEQTLASINTHVDKIAQCDPYIKREFSIDHPGEGLVLVEMADGVDMLSGEAYGRSSWKAKTEKHRVRKQKKPAMARTPLPPSAQAFVDAYVTPARLDQAIAETQSEPDIKNTGAIISWMIKDIEKEGQDDLASINLSIKQVTGLLSKDIREMWLKTL